MSHCEHRVPYKEAPDSFDIDQFYELADTGCYMSFDCFGKEESFRQNGLVGHAKRRRSHQLSDRVG